MSMKPMKLEKTYRSRTCMNYHLSIEIIAVIYRAKKQISLGLDEFGSLLICFIFVYC